MFNIAFSFSNINRGAQHRSPHHVAVESLAGRALTNILDHELPAGDSEPETKNELLLENLEIGLFVSRIVLITPIELTLDWKLNESISDYKNHVAELNPRPPKAV